MSFGRTSRLAAATIASGSLIIGALVLTPPASAAPSGPTPDQVGADWLEGQPTKGVVNFGFADYGLSIDTGLALNEVGGHKKAVKKIRKALATNINGYIAGDAFGDVGSTYAGATSKAAAFAGRIGTDPTAFGGVNLITRLQGTIAPAAPIAGRIQDISTFGDFANVIGQSFAVEALLRDKPSKAKSALTFLLQQQCSQGYFRLNFNADKTAVDQTCNGGTATESAPDTDVTALAMLSLQATGSKNADVVKSVKRAKKWLLKTQAKNGSFGGGPSTEKANANSTGLAGWALAVAGKEKAATEAAVWVRRLQAYEPNPCHSKLTKDRGAIAYDRTAYDAALVDGVIEDQWTRAAAQALPVLLWAPVSKGAPILKAPARFVQAGSFVKLKVSGLEAGERICVFSKKQAKKTATSYVSKNGRNAKIKVLTPSGTGERTFRVKSLGGTAKTVVSVLGEEVLKVKVGDATIDAGDTQSVIVSKLAAGESVKIKIGDRLVAKGVANNSGKFTASFKASGAGDATVDVTGQFADRVGTATYLVE